MKKVLLVMVAMILVGIAACGNRNETAAPTGQPAQAGDRIYVFNWGYFIDESVLDIFQEEYGIEVVYRTFESNAMLYSSLVDAGAVFDVIVPSDYLIERLIMEGLIQQLNWDNIPNRRYISDRFWDLAHDPQNLYSMPYIWGTFGIVYNTTMITEPVYSWNILWDERFRNDIFMYYSARCTIGAALQLLGYPLNPENVEQINAARDLLIAQAPLVRAFQADESISSMVGNEAALATVFNGCARWILLSNPNHNFVNPIEGMQMFLDSMVIPTNAQNVPGAEKFINFMARPDIALQNALYVQYSTTNAAAFEMLPDYWRNCPIYWPCDETLQRAEVLRDLGDLREYFYSAWSRVLLGR